MWEIRPIKRLLDPEMLSILFMFDEDINLRLDEEGKMIASVLVFPTPIDEFVIFEIYEYQKMTSESRYMIDVVDT